MKKFFYLTVFLAAQSLNLFSAGNLNSMPLGQGVNAYLNYSVFYIPEQGPYIEVYLTVLGKSVLFKKEKQKYEGKVLVDINFYKGDSVVRSGSYNLVLNSAGDTARRPDFIDVRRYMLEPGEYRMEVKIGDANRPVSEATKGTQMVAIKKVSPDSISVSDIELLTTFEKAKNPGTLTKSGYDVVPYVLRYYPETLNKLAFYTETYNAHRQLGADSRFVYVYYVEGAETKEKVAGLHTFLKQKSAPVNPLLSQFDISQLPTGEYNLVVEVRDSKNELLTERKMPFTRVAANIKIKLEDIATIDTSGTFISHTTNLDTLKDYISCLWPISSSMERDWQYNQMRKADSKLMQQYLYAFWVNRDPVNPEKEWKRYRAAAVQIKKKFACGKIPGYMTDRGRVYLQYGQPGAAQQVPAEPDSYPYEIWQYYKLKDPITGLQQTNKKFIFYNRELDGKCFELIHSDARGELRDDRWQIKLKQRNTQVMDLDQNTPEQNSNDPGNPNGKMQNFGSGANDLFQNPR
ncbi:MAG: GWxTD domain-containing protein [Bacteroidia bacterium]